jgi:hypothetical protein
VANGARLMNFKQANAKLGYIRREYWPWEKENWRWLKNAAPYKDTAIYFSAKTRDYHGLPEGRRHIPHFLGWSQAMLESNIPYDVLTDKFDGDFSPYRVVLLPNAAMMPTSWVTRLRQYLQGGGTVIATGETGALAESSFFPPQQRHLNASLTQPATIDIKDERLNERFGASSLPCDGPRMAIDTPVNAKVLAAVDSQPAVVCQPFGKGRLIYVAFCPGESVHRNPAIKGRPYRETEQTLAARQTMILFMRALVDGYAGACRLQIHNWPDDVAVFVNTHEDGARRWLNLHMIHAVNSALKPGMVHPSFYDVPTEHRTFDDASASLRLPRGAKTVGVKVLTLDKDVSAHAPWREDEGVITLKPRDVRRYSIFAIELVARTPNKSATQRERN